MSNIIVKLVRCIGAGVGCVVMVGANAVAEDKPMVAVTYADDVAPIFKQKCFSCHNPDKKSGDLDLTNYTNLMQGGASGAAIEAGDSGSSYLFSLITHASEPAMPPESPKLPDEMIEVVRKWIDGGVLETKGSKAKVKKSKSINLTQGSTSNERPAVVPTPPRLSLEPVTAANVPTAVTAIGTSPWAPLAAVAGQQQVLLYNTQTLQLVGVLPFPEGVPQVLKFSRNGSLLLAGGGRGGASGRVVVWNIASGERIIEVGDELDTVLAADISSDQSLIALGGPQRVVRIYSTESGQLMHELRKHTDWVCSLEFSPDSVLLATGDRSGGLYVWEGWTGREYLTLKAHTDCVTGVSWRSDSNLLGSCSEDGSIRLWELENGAEVKNWQGHGGGVSSLEFLRDGRIVSCGRDRVTKLWGQDGSQVRAFEAFADVALRVNYCDETNRVIAGDWTGAVRIWNAEDGAVLGELSTIPPTLAQRKAVAEEAISARRQAHQPFVERIAAANEGVERRKQDLVVAEGSLAEQSAKYDSCMAVAAASAAEMARLANDQSSLTQSIAALEQVTATLSDAVRQTNDALSKLGEDKELQAVAESLKRVQETRTSELNESRNRLTALASQLEAAQQNSARCSEELRATQSVRDEIAAKVDQVRKELAMAELALSEARNAGSATESALAAAEQDLVRWQQEIDFHANLTRLAGRRAELSQSLTAVEEQQAERQAALARAQAEVEAIDQQASAIQNEISQVETELSELRKRPN